MHVSAFSFREGCGGSPLSSNRAFLISMGRNFRTRKELKWVFSIYLPQVREARLLSSPAVITCSCFETLDIPVGSTVHLSSTSDHRDHNTYPVGGPSLPPWPSHGVVIQPRIKSSLYMQLLCLQSALCELRFLWNLIMKIQAYYAQWVPVTLSIKNMGNSGSAHSSCIFQKSNFGDFSQWHER